MSIESLTVESRNFGYGPTYCESTLSNCNAHDSIMTLDWHLSVFAQSSTYYLSSFGLIIRIYSLSGLLLASIVLRLVALAMLKLVVFEKLEVVVSEKLKLVAPNYLA